ncbi:hypothetical protein P5673_019615 [Acropora cervicornis]|uniref:Uncharacterized protein n=1 Tax=Acropora cervicornis TaxID=6130 RepID=A0AAD9V1S5_ACRCE|nr:hypothetical protein P5673_019615 [Acropora cervicornis]
MAYQRTEYADKTMFMNSMQDRKLKMQLDSIDFHRETIGKEIDREKKKLQRELAEVESGMKSRLTLPDPTLPSDGARKLSPRLPRRYSTPQVLLSTTTSSRNLPADVDRRSASANRARVYSEGNTEMGSLGEKAFTNPTRPISPTSQFLLPPLSQPRRQSLPPINIGPSLVAFDSVKEGVNARRGSGNVNKSPRACMSPNTLSPRGTPRRGSVANDTDLEEVASKVERFLQRMDLSQQEETSTMDAKEGERNELVNKMVEYTNPTTSDRNVKGTSSFQPMKFE